MNQSLTDPVARWNGDEKSSAPSTVFSSLSLSLSLPLSLSLTHSFFFFLNKNPLLNIKERRSKLGLHHSDDFGLQGFSFLSSFSFSKKNKEI